MFVRTIVPKEVEADIIEAYGIFANNLPICLNCSDQTNSSGVIITINITERDRKPTLATEESYYLEIVGSTNTVSVNISSKTFFGTRHALETLTQLIWYDKIDKSLKIFHDILIEDRPEFPHRGLMIDTARNFFPITLLQKAVDGMAATKLNILHLHLTDVTSFPIVLPNNPGFAEAGAYSSEMVYTPEDIRSKFILQKKDFVN